MSLFVQCPNCGKSFHATHGIRRGKSFCPQCRRKTRDANRLKRAKYKAEQDKQKQIRLYGRVIYG